MGFWQSSTRHRRAYKPNHAGRPTSCRSPEAGYDLEIGLENYSSRGFPTEKNATGQESSIALENLNS